MSKKYLIATALAFLTSTGCATLLPQLPAPKPTKSLEAVVEQKKTSQAVDSSSTASKLLANSTIDYIPLELCFDISSGKFYLESSALDDLRQKAMLTFDEYLSSVGIESNPRGILTKKIRRNLVDIKGRQVYILQGRMCVSLEMYSPKMVDLILEDVDPTERIIESQLLFSRRAYSFIIVDDNRRILQNSSENRSFQLTNRALPWAHATRRLFREYSLSPGQEIDLWERCDPHGKGIINRDSAKALYEVMTSVIENNQSK